MARPRVLMTMFNIASWSGLHENVWYSCQGLRDRGWDVTVACRSGQLVELLRTDGTDVHVIEDWRDWSGDAVTLRQRRWDLVHTHPFASRALGLAVAAGRVPVVSTFHGNNIDGLADWQREASMFIAVSRAHAEMLQVRGGVDRDRVEVISNGVRSALCASPLPAVDERLRATQPRIVVASRLDPDKRRLVDCVDAITDALGRVPTDQQWTIEILGGGRLTADLGRFTAEQTDKVENLRFELSGWVDSEQVPDRLRRAVIAVASGRGAAQSLAVGTPVVAFGSQGVYGLQHGTNLSLGLWGNFGGYPLEGKVVTDIGADIGRLLSDRAFYRKVQVAGRRAVESQLLQTHADDRLDALYRRVLRRRRPWLPRLGRLRRWAASS